ncbi:GAF domain-containing protein [Streptomyces sp. NPDC101776]|uniref:GAF domain-containing protein n=1 Tax=Streptomyces sp. NPDC101776 TaxID=3366146 RepID=UPI00380F066A
MDGDDGVSGSEKGSADRFALARRAVSAIGSTLDERRTAAECARFLVDDGLCDAAAVDLFAQDEARPAPHGMLHPMAAVGRKELLDSLRTAPREDVMVRALDAGHPITTSFTTNDHGVLAALSVPLTAWGKAYGALLAIRAGRPFGDDEAAVH